MSQYNVKDFKKMIAADGKHKGKMPNMSRNTIDGWRYTWLVPSLAAGGAVNFRDTALVNCEVDDNSEVALPAVIRQGETKYLHPDGRWSTERPDLVVVSLTAAVGQVYLTVRPGDKNKVLGGTPCLGYR